MHGYNIMVNDYSQGEVGSVKIVYPSWQTREKVFFSKYMKNMKVLAAEKIIKFINSPFIHTGMLVPQ